MPAPDIVRFIDGLSAPVLPGVFNPWRDRCDADLAADAPDQRRSRLVRHLSLSDCRLVLIGEAPGWAGCRISGVPFTSEFLLQEGAIPRLADHRGRRLSNRRVPFREPSAGIVWSVLYQLGVAEQTVLWNAFPWHPMGDRPLSNRTPTATELDLGLDHLRRMLALFPSAHVVAVGQKAAGSLARIGIGDVAAVRHPAYGGKADFVSGLEALVRRSRR